MTVLKNDSIILRALEPGDVDTLYQWENNPEIWYLSNTLAPFSRHLLEQYVLGENDLYANKQLRLMICSPDGAKKGAVDLFDFSPFHQRAGIGILIADQSDRQKGIGSSCITLMMEYCFNTLRLNQLYCNILASNEASIQLFKKAGFHLAGTKKDWIRNEHGWEDELLLQFFAREWIS